MTKFDKTLRPQDDFFGYVNNDWLKKNPIPADESVWGTFNVLRDKSTKAIRNIIKDLSKQDISSLDYNQKLINIFFSTAVKYNELNKNHRTTIKELFKKIDNLTDKQQLAKYLGAAHRNGFSPFWTSYVSLDDKNSKIQALRLYQAGISLPDRDYYLDKTVKISDIRAGYKKYFHQAIQTISDLRVINWQNVWKIELLLAKASWTNIKLRDIEKNYNHFSLASLMKQFPNFDWKEYFQAENWQNPNDNIIVDQPSFIGKSLEIINNLDLDIIKDYLRWTTLNELMRWIDEKSSKVAFDFYGRKISGKTEDNNIWKKVINHANRLVVGELLGKEYASRYFPEESKHSVLKLVDDVKKAYHHRIDTNSWMGNKTKQKAHKKLDNIRTLIGYPSKWKDFKNLSFCDNNHIENILASHRFHSDMEMAKIGKKPPAEDWQMNAHTVNAYNDPNQLVICFPAAILQPPFYNPKASYATNLGGIGSVIAHELTHGFDDQGAQFDESGNVKQWINNNEIQKFKNLAKYIINQADNYQPLPGMFLKGKLVLGEVIADIGGIELAIEALKNKKIYSKKSLRELFINASVAECGAIREECLIERIKTDPHPPSKFRINCTMCHVDDFYKIFNVQPEDKMYLPPEKRARIW